MNGVGSSNSCLPLGPPNGGYISDVSDQHWHEVISTRRELNGQTDFHYGDAHHEVDQNARLDVQDFYSDHNPNLFLD